MRPKNNPGLPSWRGDALRLRRLHGGWTLKQLGDRLEVSESTVARWESGEHSPPADLVAKIAELFDAPRASFSREPRII